MKSTFWVMAVIAVGLTLLVYRKDPALVFTGLKTGFGMLMGIVPALVFGFWIAGMITVIMPTELLTRLLGEESGLKGLLIATVGGMLTPGGPFVQFPIVNALLQQGAAVAPVVTYLSAWALMGINRFLVYEVPLLGWKLAVTRILASLAFPALIGLLTKVIWSRL
ncbi:MAG: permease [Deltaproteobacteria bacterium]|jgi:uncharacterized membrane protein YraQ (UPF0718 family)|nr:permease [Deltaproteobacteria bacterium]